METPYRSVPLGHFIDIMRRVILPTEATELVFIDYVVRTVEFCPFVTVHVQNALR